jgi:hypothetical protein
MRREAGYFQPLWLWLIGFATHSNPKIPMPMDPRVRPAKLSATSTVVKGAGEPCSQNTQLVIILTEPDYEGHFHGV